MENNLDKEIDYAKVIKSIKATVLVHEKPAEPKQVKVISADLAAKIVQ
ncbi:hypothetical protein [Pedobacter borealis]|nr:hypothetical protein [Pedobacter borealis]